MRDAARKSARVFKTAWFAKASKKARILDPELCAAIQQVMLGQCDDLGGGVFKKRLDKNRARSIILAKGGQYWVYEFLYAKKDQSNITPDDLLGFRSLAKSYESLTVHQVMELVHKEEWKEICDDHD